LINILFENLNYGYFLLLFIGGGLVVTGKISIPIFLSARDSRLPPILVRLAGLILVGYALINYEQLNILQ